MNTVPLPEPAGQTDAERGYSLRQYTPNQMCIYAAAVSADKDAQIERMRMALRSAEYLIDANKLTCHHLHHRTKDFHEWDEPCGVEEIAKQHLESVLAALKESKS